MKTKVTTLLLLLINTLYSQINFENETLLFNNTHYSFNASSIISIDIDNNNYNDIIIASREISSGTDGKIIWYENNNGNLFFKARKVIANLISPSSIYPTDINNNGLIDIVVTSDYGDFVGWYENLGNGDFSSINFIDINIDKPTSVIATDLDNDGDNDIIVGVYNNNSVVWYENLGNEGFSSLNIIYTTSYGVRKVVTKDLDNDGLLDIISGDTGGSIYWSKNLGNGNFDIKSYITGSANDGTAIDFIDINNDGFYDLITSDNYNDEVKYFINQAGNSFSSQYIIDDTNDNPHDVKVFDFNFDGLDDLFVSFFGSNSRIGYYKNNGNGNFSPLVTLTSNISNPKTFIIDDINNDNYIDIISSSNGPGNMGKVSYFKNSTDNINFSENILSFKYLGFAKETVIDLNNDGNKDLVSATTYGILINENYGNSTLGSQKLITDLSDNSVFYKDYEFVDFNNDGLLDFTTVTNGGIRNYINLGDNNFEINFSVDINYIKDIEVSDLNNDGYKDILYTITSTSNRGLYWLPNIDGVNFNNPRQIDFPDESYYYNPHNIRSGDIDNDGDIDIIVSSEDSSALQALLNDGNANFSYQLLSHLSTYKLILYDFDNNGFLDIITSGIGNGNADLSFLKNNNGTFSPPVVLDSFHSINDISIGDINNDGYKDIVCSFWEDYYVKDLYYYLFDGNSFQNPILIKNMEDDHFGNHITIGDINNDNLNDIIISKYPDNLYYMINSSTLSVIDSNSNKTFKIYPLPFDNKINWTNDFDAKKSFDIKIYDIYGKNIYSITDYNNDNINLNFLFNGIYIINFSNNNLNYSYKIIKK